LDDANIHTELASKKNGYSPSQFHIELQTRGRTRETDKGKKPVSTTVPLIVQNLSSCVDRIQEQYNMKTIHMLQPNTCSILR
jgi:ABC-type transport system involved in Fe-S cluster assembly fused permease/ATPase subunit